MTVEIDRFADSGTFERMSEVVARGTGEVEALADQAEIRVSFTADAGSRDAAVESLAQRMPDVDSALARDGVEIRDRTLHVGDRWHGDRRTGAMASQHLTIRVVDLGALDGVVAALVAARPEHLDGPHWQLRDETAAVRDAQAKAVADARGRAEAYAGALGGRLGALVRIADEGVDRPFPAHGGGMRMLAATADLAGMQESVRDLGLTPSPITARVSCVATWELEL